MALSIVDLFEPVHVDIGQHERRACPVGAGNLTFEDDGSKLASVGAGQVIDLRVAELSSRKLTIEQSGSAIGRGMAAAATPNMRSAAA